MTMLLRRRLMGGKAKDYSLYAIHKDLNPKVMAIVYAQGWSASPDFMTFAEAAAVTSVGTVFNAQDIDGFDEFQYFTGLTSIEQNAFRNCKVTSLIIPDGVTQCNTRSFSNCTKLKNITFPSTFTTVRGNYFLYGASSLNWIKCYASTAPTIATPTTGDFGSIKQGGILYHPTGSNYSSWFTVASSILTNRGWTTQTF